MPSVESAMNKSKDTQLVSNLSLLDSGAKIYTIENGKAPTSLQELVDKKYVPDKNYEGITYSAGTEGGSSFYGHVKQRGKGQQYGPGPAYPQWQFPMSRGARKSPAAMMLTCFWG